MQHKQAVKTLQNVAQESGCGYGRMYTAKLKNGTTRFKLYNIRSRGGELSDLQGNIFKAFGVQPTFSTTKPFYTLHHVTFYI